MSKANQYCSFKPLIPPRFDTPNQDMCHDIIGSGVIKCESQLDWNYNTV